MTVRTAGPRDATALRSSTRAAVGRPDIVPIPTGSGAPTSPRVAHPASPPIARFIELEIEARKCADLDTLRFAIANAPGKLADIEQALLFEPAGDARFTATRSASIGKLDRQAPVVRALEALLRSAGQHPTAARLKEPQLLDLARIARDMALDPHDYPRPHAVWLPITSRDGHLRAALLIQRSTAWLPQQMALLMPLADVYGHAWAALAPHNAGAWARLRRFLKRTRLVTLLAIAAVAAAFTPVPMSTIAPAEIVAAEPMLVTAPLDGVVSEVLVPPGSWVDKGVPIVRLVDVKLRNDVDIASRSRGVAEARHFKALQAALATAKDQHDVATTKSELDLADTELRYATELLSRTVIHAERSGLLIYAAKADLVGKPVGVGEKLMEIGDPAKSELRIDLQVSDAVTLDVGSPVSLFLDSDPLRAVDGTITRTSYRPSQAADQQLVYRLFATFTEGERHRIGLRGVARVSGKTVSLGLFLFRRPITAVRQRFGL